MRRRVDDGVARHADSRVALSQFLGLTGLERRVHWRMDRGMIRAYERNICEPYCARAGAVAWFVSMPF